MPVLLIEGRERLLVGLGETPRTSGDRRALLFHLGRRFSGLRPKRITIVMDAYMKMSESGVELPLKGSLADDPASTECLVVASLGQNDRSLMVMCPYERIPTLEGLEIRFETAKVDTRNGKLYLSRHSSTELGPLGEDGYFLLKAKCLNCGLHFLLAPGRLRRHSRMSLWCPECGHHG